MITISRNQARQLRAVFRRCGIKPKVALEQRPRFIAGSDGLRIRARVMDVAVEYHLPGEFPSEGFSLPLDFLNSCAGRSNDLVSIESRARGKVVASWLDGGVPQQLHYDGKAPPRELEFPELPEEFAAAGDDLWQALRDAVSTVDSQSVRFALSHVQLRGQQGQIVSTDGRQALVQGGFSFPWSDDVLIPAQSVLGCTELAQFEPLAIGRTEDWVALRLGPWTVLLKINKEGRYPRVEDILGSARFGPSKLSLAADDAEFLTAALPKLPSNDPNYLGVTLDLYGEVLVRAKAHGGDAPTELLLPNSRLAGDPVRIHMDRRFLARALKLGFREMIVTEPSKPVLCEDGRRQYIWALLGSADAIEASVDAIRIEPPRGTEVVTNTAKPKLRVSRNTMSETNTTPQANGSPAEAPVDVGRQDPPVASSVATNDGAGSSGSGAGPAVSTKRSQRTTDRKSGRQNTGSPIEQAVALKQSLRQTLTQTSELIRTLKRQKKQNSLVASTLKSLKELQHAG